jgi:hypothetical protein
VQNPQGRRRDVITKFEFLITARRFKINYVLILRRRVSPRGPIIKFNRQIGFYYQRDKRTFAGERISVRGNCLLILPGSRSSRDEFLRNQQNDSDADARTRTRAETDQHETSISERDFEVPSKPLTRLRWLGYSRINSPYLRPVPWYAKFARDKFDVPGGHCNDKGCGGRFHRVNSLLR